MATTKRVGILTGGGDVPGLNMCLKSLVYRLIDLGYEPIGVRKGWDGLIQYHPSDPTTYTDHFIELTKNMVRPIDRTPGSFLHSSRVDPRFVPVQQVPEFMRDKTQETQDLTDHLTDVVNRLGYIGLIVIGDDDTIREVYHLNKRVEDYEETLWMLKEMGHHLAPHIIIGHHFGEIKGEWRALEMVTKIGVETIVLVIIKPLLTTEKSLMKIPRPEETSRISAIARILNPSIPIRMGCIRPAHPWKAEMEKGFILSGVNTVTYPLQGTIEFANELGLEARFIEMCCSLL